MTNLKIIRQEMVKELMKKHKMKETEALQWTDIYLEVFYETLNSKVKGEKTK